MAIAFKVPELGDDVESGIVVSVMVSVGDTISVDQPVLELETDKAVLEVPSSVSGVIEEIMVKSGDEIGPGQDILTVAEGNGAESASAETVQATESAPEPAEEPEPQPEPALESTAPPSANQSSVVDFKIPELGDDVESGIVVSVMVSVGDSIAVDQSLLELETDKAVLEVPADVSGIISEILVAEGDEVGPGQAVMKIEATSSGVAAPSQPTPSAPAKPEPARETAREAAPVKAAAEPKPASPPTSATPAKPAGVGEKLHEYAPAAPSTRIFAREIGVDINYVSGSGPGGRISKDDVKAYSRQLQSQVAQRQPSKAAAGGATVSQQPLPDFSQWGGNRTRSDVGHSPGDCS